MDELLEELKLAYPRWHWVLAYDGKLEAVHRIPHSIGNAIVITTWHSLGQEVLFDFLLVEECITVCKHYNVKHSELQTELAKAFIYLSRYYANHELADRARTWLRSLL